MTARKHGIALLLLCAMAASPCLGATAQERIAALAPDQCTFDMVAMIVDQEVAQKDLEMAKQQVEVMEELERISAPAKDNTRSIGEQIDKAAVAEFNRLSQRFGAMNLSRYNESKRTNDMTVLRKMLEVADHDKNWGQIVDKSHPDFAIQTVLDLFRGVAELMPEMKPTFTDANGGACSLDWALRTYESAALQRLGASPVDTAGKQLQEIAARNHMEKIDRAKLPPADQAQYDHVMTAIVAPANAEVQFAYDIENIRLMAQVSKLNYESEKEDILASGGDIKYIGTTIADKTKKESFDKRTTFALTMWKKLDESYPPPYLNQMKKLGEIMYPKK